MWIVVSNRLASGAAGCGLKSYRARLGVPGLLVLCAVGGCGALLGEETARLDVAFDRTGTLQSDGIYESMTTSDAVRVGDSQNNLEVRGFISVNLNLLPATATVTQALLQFKGSAPAGNPFGDFVGLFVDHVNVVSGIDVDDFDDSTAVVFTRGIATISPLPTFDEEDVSIDVTNEINADLAAGRPISSFRLRFGQAPTVDGQADAVFVEAFDDDPAFRPSALVRFRP